MISKYFKRSEFKCKCGQCNCDTVDAVLLGILDDVREHFDAPVSVNSGHRCAAHNAKVGGATSSQHLLGRAADIRVKGKTPKEVIQYLVAKYPTSYCFIQYDSFVHVDSRKVKYHKML